MKYRILGKTNLKVSEICYGTAFWGGRTTYTQAKEIFYFCIDKGINFFDTAEVYGSRWGEAEEILGDFLKESKKRKDLVISTKVHGYRDGRYQTKKEILESIENSLKRLKTDYVDIYFLHWPDPFTPIEEVLETMDKVVKSGKARFIGMSNYMSWEVFQAIELSKNKGLTQPYVLQEIFNIVDFDVNFEKYELAKKLNLGYMAYSPLASGFLTGKYKKDFIPPDTRGFIKPDWEEKRWKWRFSEYGWKVLQEVEILAKNYSCSVSQLSLALVLCFDTVSCVIDGSRTVEQLKENIKCIDLKIDKNDFEKIKDLSYFLF
ncbi:MAG: aldo/keto reductase [Endomicrobiia bacterium]